MFMLRKSGSSATFAVNLFAYLGIFFVRRPVLNAKGPTACLWCEQK
jgi:hypothetical protein